MRTKTNIPKALAAMQKMTVKQLREKHIELFGEESRSGNRQWLFRRCAWRLQALAEGDLSQRARRRARELARNVEAFHGIVESELYAVEDLSSETLLRGRSRTYQAYFNHVRKNRWRGGKTPAMILAEAGSRVNPEAPTPPPIRLETIPLEPLLLQQKQPGTHVPVLLTRPDIRP